MKRIFAAFLGVVLILSAFGSAEAATLSAGGSGGTETRWLEPAELSALTDSLDPKDNGFFLSTYDRPEEIDWHEVFYCGAGISVEPTAEQIREWEAEYGELWTSLEVIPESALDAFALEKTGVTYYAARHPLSTRWTYLADSGCWAMAHGDTNFQPIQFTDGWVEGDVYHLFYTRPDWKSYTESREFVMTAEIRDGQWRYISNLPADAPAPETLLTIDFYAAREEAQQAGAVSRFIEIEPQPYDEPEGWCWAVITARQDGVRYTVERVHPVFDYEPGCALVPGDSIASDVLDAGETVALYVNMPWQPGIRITATWGDYWGEYCFGEDNGLILADSAPRYVTGHDLAGEGRGCAPQSQAELTRFLTDGDWVCRDENTGEPLATVAFTGSWQMDITTRDEAYPIYVSYDRIFAEEWEAPDLMCLERAAYYETGWTPLPDWYTVDDFGDYLISAVQLDGEQVLYLNQANNGEAALGYLLPNGGEDVHSVTLHRFRGAGTEEPQDLEGGVDPRAEEPAGAPAVETDGWVDSALPYLIRVAEPPVPYYAGPGYGYEIAGWIEEAGVFTIVEEAYDGTAWGHLKSGAGWVCLDDVEFYEG